MSHPLQPWAEAGTSAAGSRASLSKEGFPPDPVTAGPRDCVAQGVGDQKASE